MYTCRTVASMYVLRNVFVDAPVPYPRSVVQCRYNSALGYPSNLPTMPTEKEVHSAAVDEWRGTLGHDRRTEEGCPFLACSDTANISYPVF